MLKGGRRHELVDAVGAAHRDEGYVSPSLAALLMRNQATTKNGAAAKSVSELTFREGQIFDLLSKGLKNKEIGIRLNLSEKSIKRYVTCIFEKLNVRNRVEAAMLSKARSPGPAAKMPNVAASGNAAPTSPALLPLNRDGLIAAACSSNGNSKDAGTFTSELKLAGASAVALTAHYFHAVFGGTRFAPDPSSDGIPAGSQSAGKHIVL